MAVANAADDKAKKVKEKVEIPPDTVIANEYTKATKSVEANIETLQGLLADLKNQASEVSLNSEMRRRATDVYNHDRDLERQREKDEQDREDRERDIAFQERETKLRNAEDEFLTILGAKRDGDGVPTPRVIREAFAKYVKSAEDAAFAKGVSSVKSDYETNKRVDVAEAKEKTALMEQKVTFLEKRNTELEKQNTELLKQSTENLDKMKDLAGTVAQAAAGITDKANQNMANTSQAAAGGRPPVR